MLHILSVLSSPPFSLSMLTRAQDIKTFLKDTTHWSNALLQQQLAAKDPHFVDVINSWVEQRAWGIDYALGALPDAHPLKVRTCGIL